MLVLDSVVSSLLFFESCLNRVPHSSLGAVKHESNGCSPDFGVSSQERSGRSRSPGPGLKIQEWIVWSCLKTVLFYNLPRSETHRLCLMSHFSTVLKVMYVISTTSLQVYTWLLLFRVSSAYLDTPSTKQRWSLIFVLLPLASLVSAPQKKGHLKQQFDIKSTAHCT